MRWISDDLAHKTQIPMPTARQREMVNRATETKDTYRFHCPVQIPGKKFKLHELFPSLFNL